MMKSNRSINTIVFTLISALFAFSFSASAAPKIVDRVVAIVDQSVILQSEVDDIVNRVKENAKAENQQLPSDQALKTQAVERLIVSALQMQMAERMGLKITDIQLDQALENLSKRNNQTLAQLRDTLISSGENYEKFREDFRQEMTINETQRINVHRRIYISPQEIDSLLKLLEKSGDNQEEFRLSHILIDTPSKPSADEISASKQRAEKVVELLNSGSEFAKLARGASSGAKALEGGDMGWMNINEMPSLFAEMVREAKKNDIIGPFRSGAGFHILKIKDIRGRETVEINEVKSRHILLTPSIILSESKAKQMLIDFRADILAGKSEFATLAKDNSEDPGSALKGGELGWAEPRIYVPSFREQVESLPIGEISEPFRSSHGWHIVEVLEKRTTDATANHKKERVYGMLYNRKFAEESERWLREIRDQAYIEIIND